MCDETCARVFHARIATRGGLVLSGSFAFAAPDRSAPILFSIPCWDEEITRRGQMRLALHVPVRVPEERAVFLERLLARTVSGIVIDRSRFTDPPLVARHFPLPIILPGIAPAPPAAEPGQAKDNRDKVITPLMEAVEKIVIRVARAAHEMPNNPALGELAGGKGRNVVSRALQRLDRAGRLTIELANGKRRVVLADGAATGWGAFAIGVHKPYSKTPKGAAPDAKPKRPDYKPVEAVPFRYRIEPQRLAEFDDADTCQWPLWSDGAKAEGVSDLDKLPTLFCGAPVKRGKSYCADHVSGAFLLNTRKCTHNVRA